jgi:hypothetical protein
LNVHVTPYSFSSPKIRRSMTTPYAGRGRSVGSAGAPVPGSLDECLAEDDAEVDGRGTND